VGGGEDAVPFQRAQGDPLGHPGIGEGLGIVALQVAGERRLGQRPAGDGRGQVQVDELQQLRQMGRGEWFDAHHRALLTKSG
jgi:hypothetical protein